LRLVPENVSFCLVLTDLRGHGQAFVDSPFVKQFRDSPLGAKLLDAPETKSLGALDDYLQSYLHVSAVQLRDEILGDALVLAYRQGPEGKSDQDQGLILVKARDGKLLAELVQRLNDVQTKSGDLKELEERSFQGSKYYRRVEEKSSSYYYLHGQILAFAPHEQILQELIGLDHKAAPGEEPPLARHLRLLGVDKPLAALWLNPRAFDAELEKKAAEAGTAEAAALKNLLLYWKALDGLALSFDVQKDFELAVAARVEVEKLPASARRFLQTAAEPTDLWNTIPDNALLALAGRVDVAALLEVLGEFSTEEARKTLRSSLESLGAALEQEVQRDLLAQLGPDGGLFVTPPADGSKDWFPQVTGVLRVRGAAGPNSAEEAVKKTLNFLAMAAVFGGNKENPGRISLKTVTHDKTDIKYLVNQIDFPPGLQPAFGFKEGYLVLASSPETVRRFRAPAAARALSSSSEIPILKVSLREVGTYLKAHRQAIVAYVAARNQLAPEDAANRMDQLLVGIQAFDRIDLSRQTASSRTTFRLRVQMSQPLR
jgi:hypothetical protein